MQQTQAIQLIAALVDDDYEATLYEDYSGRSMYGATTCGVTSDATPETVAYVCGQNDLCRPRSDSLGMSYIYY